MFSLVEYVDRYCLARDLSPHYQRGLKARMRHLERFSGHPVPISPVDYELVNRWLCAVSSTKAPHTTRSYRTYLIVLLNGGGDEGLCPYPETRRIRRTRCPQLTPEGWTTEEVRGILSVCQTERGIIGGIPAATWWGSLVRSGYDTGLRKSDLLRLTVRQIQQEAIVLVQKKTGKMHITRLRPSTIAVIQSTFSADRKLIWPWPYCDEKFCDDFRAIVARAGLKGTFKYLRRTSGSLVQFSCGRGSEHLGHSDPAVFRRHYEIQAITRQSVPLPPEL